MQKIADSTAESARSDKMPKNNDRPEDKILRFPPVPPEEKETRDLLEEQLCGVLESMLIKMEYAEFQNKTAAARVSEIIEILSNYSYGETDSDLALAQIKKIIDEGNFGS
jgi:hypothetical protein